MKCAYNPLNNQDGSIITLVLLILATVTVLGVTSTQTTTTEVQIATNDNRHKMAFYAAESGREIGRQMLEENIACAQGFDDPTAVPAAGVEVKDSDFYLQEADDIPDEDYTDFLANEDLYLPETETRVFFVGVTRIIAGSALQMAAGYEGKAKGSAGGGVMLLYDVYSQSTGIPGALSTVRIGYRHLVGQEGDCKY
jgi:hypothetical protein